MAKNVKILDDAAHEKVVDHCVKNGRKIAWFYAQAVREKLEREENVVLQRYDIIAPLKRGDTIIEHKC